VVSRSSPIILAPIQWSSRLAGIEQLVVVSRCPVLLLPPCLEREHVENRVFRVHRVDCEVRWKCIPD
jgi:hypothetical protein